jgi:hypothetical protein
LKEIYLVAGERNMLTAGAQGGLWANVGETRVGVEERLRGGDYRRKAAGGAWRILARWQVPEGFSDRDIHPILRAHEGVRTAGSANGEEFFFEGDRGDGSVAIRILGPLMPLPPSTVWESPWRGERGVMRDPRWEDVDPLLRLKLLGCTLSIALAIWTSTAAVVVGLFLGVELWLWSML